MNEGRIYLLYMRNRLSGRVDYDQFYDGIEIEQQDHSRLSEEELVELVVKKLEIEPDYYTARTESSIEEIEPIGERERPILPRRLGKPRRTRIEFTLPPGEREENPSSDRRLLKLRKLLENASVIIDEIWQEDTGNVGMTQAKIHIMDAHDQVVWEITGESPRR